MTNMLSSQGPFVKSWDFGIQEQHIKDKMRKPQSKRIIICCDGTWQSAVSGEKNVPSNVTRLCRAINPVGTDKAGQEWQQVVWYDSGVGTTSLSMGTAIEGATGQGLEGNVIEAYNFCVLNYNIGDQIMVFGFSRGAYTARTIAGVITDIGLCYQKDLNQFPELWTQYKAFKREKKNKGKRFFRSETWFKWMWGSADETQGAGDATKGSFVISEGNHGKPCRDHDWALLDNDWAQPGSRSVEVVGVYDTVGAIGMPEVVGFKVPQWALFWKEKPDWHNVGLSTHIKHAFQALAIDERRKAFEPTLFYVPFPPTSNNEVELTDEVHSNKEKFYKELKDARALKENNDPRTPTDAEVNAAANRVNTAALNWSNAIRHLMNYQDKMESPTELKQVWFPGYHINIGGGSSSTMENKGNMEEMSNIAYAWMLDQVKLHLSLDEDHIEEEYEIRKRNFEKNNKLCEKWNKMTEKEGWGAWAWRRSAETASAVIHPLTPSSEPPFKKNRRYDWGTAEMEDSFTNMYWPNGQHIRTPGRYAFKNGGRDKLLGETFESIHPVVQYRIDRCKNNKVLTEYVPRGPEYTREPVDGGYVWHLKYSFDDELITLPEWKLGGPECYERKAIVTPEAQSWVQAQGLGSRTESKSSNYQVKTIEVSI
ncbi:hypothetical protein N7478_009235 [Penicillium angulare]|uniref:uncharacterized protein n=1 Tax=Penicillium angulare TaxID=116970 RepID=UPI00253F9AF8|nr:uncharacterized protein N7478_009235 [Penicillium angulare]KAJ5274110.1 hypothetical protein N7478_009235 [Penicillium angulare]